jgi:BirA family biotin operon repressor/biotin-[acetyl-CoA-carboxylase] ligase
MPARDLAQTPLDIGAVAGSIQARRLGGPLHYYPEIGSTNTVARRLAERGGAEGEIVVAEAQSGGRGRLGRTWESPPFSNLYLSLILRPHLAPRHAPQITLSAAIALAETIQNFLAEAPQIKWPNDILVGGKKLAGVLTEAACGAERIHYVILGIGLNVNYRRAAMPEELRARATSLAEISGKMLARESVLTRLIHDLDRCYGELEDSGFGILCARWEKYFGLRGRSVRAEHNGRAIVGRALGIDSEGGLILEDNRGQRYSIIAGDVIAVES